MPFQIDREQKHLRSRLKPGTKFHSDILQLINDRFSMSEKAISKRYDRWRDSENQHLAYVDPDKLDVEGKSLFPFARSIVVPYTYAIIDTRLTFFFMAFSSKNPIIPIEGVGPNDIIPAKFMEVVNEYQMNETAGLAVLYSWLKDAERYGMGIIKNLWHERNESKVVVRREPISFFGIKLSESLKKSVENVLVYEGNLPCNISPFHFFPDPRVSVSQLQDGEFVGHKMSRSHNHMLNKEFQEEYFNVSEFLPQKVPGQDQIRGTEDPSRVNADSNLATIVGMSDIGHGQSVDAKDKGYHTIKELSIDLVPDDFDLANRKRPEQWLMTIGDDKTIIKCEPSIYREFPYYVLEPNYDYASPANLGTVELATPMNDILSWLFNSHMENVRKIINDVLIVDPSLIELKDILRPGPAKIIRMKEDAYGLGMMDKAVKQLQVSDITRNHISDGQNIINLMQRIFSVTDNLMGMPEEVKRTATETTNTMNMATARLRQVGRIYAILGVMPWYRSMTFNNQSFLSQGRWFRIVDRIAEELGHDPIAIANRVFIKPEDLYGNYDFKYPNLELPSDRIENAKVMREILKEMLQSEVLMNEFSVGRVFTEALFNLGVTNISEFRSKPLQTRVVPDTEVSKQVEKGNLIPANQAFNNPEVLNRIREQFFGQLGNGANGVPTFDQRFREEQEGV